MTPCVESDAGDILVYSLPFLFALAPAPGATAPDPVAVAFTVADATAAIDPASVGAEIVANATVDVPLQLTACDDRGAQPCSPGGGFDVSGYMAAGVAPDLDPDARNCASRR
jgi:hypothetical protein